MWSSGLRLCVLATWLPPRVGCAWAQIEIAAKRNEIIDQSSLIARYQQEVALLRGQLEIVMREREWSPSGAPPLSLLWWREGERVRGVGGWVGGVPGWLG